MKKHKILVAGATGNQGGSVVKALISDYHDVVGISRNLQSPKAQKLKEQGVEMVSVDFTNKDELVKIMKKVDTVFSLTTPFEKGPENEITQGKSMASAAQEAGVGHFIFNSVGDANKITGVPHFDSKYEVEKHISLLGLPYTIIGPTYFMDNLFYPTNLGNLKEGWLKMALPGHRKLQYIAVEDIGKFVAIVVNEREKMFSRRINISGDELTGIEAAEILSRVTEKKIKYQGFDPSEIEAKDQDMATMYRWFKNTGYSADLTELKNYGFLTFEEWAHKQNWSKVKEAEPLAVL